MSQRELAIRIGTQQSAVSDVFRGHTDVRWSTLMYILYELDMGLWATGSTEDTLLWLKPTRRMRQGRSKQPMRTLDVDAPPAADVGGGGGRVL